MPPLEGEQVSGGVQPNTETPPKTEQPNTDTGAQTPATATATTTETKTQGSLISSAGKTAETKAEDGQPDGEKKGEAEGDTKEGAKTETKAPESYADFKLPEGVPINSEAMNKFKAVAKELNLTQEQAQRLVDLQAETVQASVRAQTEEFEAMGRQWEADTRKELGVNLESELAMAAKARDQFASPALVQLLNETHLGNHVEFVKFFAAVGKAVSEDKFAAGKTAPQTQNIADRFYSSSN